MAIALRGETPLKEMDDGVERPYLAKCQAETVPLGAVFRAYGFMESAVTC